MTFTPTLDAANSKRPRPADPSALYLTDRQTALRYGVNRSTLWRWLKTDLTFPKPILLSPGCSRWRLSELESWEATKASRTEAA